MRLPPWILGYAFSVRPPSPPSRTPRLLSRLSLGSSFQQLLDTPVVLPGLSSIIDRYSIILLDQFGVLHDGNELHPGVAEFLAELRKKEKTTVILSNTSNRRATAAQRLEAMGVRGQDPHLVMTSGECAYEWLRQKAAEKQTSPLKIAWITWQNSRQQDYFAGMEHDIEVVPVESADVLFFHGAEAIAVSATERHAIPFITDGDVAHPALHHVLSNAAARRLPAVCANLDHTAVTPSREINFMPGLMKEAYERMGGHCVGFGKPHPEFFEAAIAAARVAVAAPATNPNPNPYQKLRVLHIGDSLSHDIAGAAAAGVDSVLVTADGVHREALTDTRSAQIQSNPDVSWRASLDLDGPQLEKSLLQKVCDLADEKQTPRPTFVVRHCRL